MVAFADGHWEEIMKKMLALVVIAIVAAGFLGFTTPGHRVLNTLGFATADDHDEEQV
jgi:hypothetical protein